MTGELRRLADRLFAAIERGCPLAWTELAANGAGLSIAVVSGDAFGVEFSEDGPRTCAAPSNAHVAIDTDVATLEAVVFGELDLESALLDDRIVALGSVDDLARLSDLVRWVVAGAARTDEAEALGDELSALAAANDGGA